MKNDSFKSRQRHVRAPDPTVVPVAGENGYANPQGMTVVSGSAHSTQQGNIAANHHFAERGPCSGTVSISPPGETTIFHQPSTTSIVFNNINNANPTTIYGSLQANGIVVLENQSGFYFGPQRFCEGGRVGGDDGGDQSLGIGRGRGLEL